MPDNVLIGKVVITAPGVEQTFAKVAASTTKAELALKKLPQVSNQSALALNNLSRVAQDAPYGFIGIANNINPLLESLQRLKASTGTTGGALKALGASLTGAGGIGLAVGVVSSLLVVFGDKLFGASKAAKEAADANQELAKSIVGDLSQLTVLVGIIQNVNTSTENRAKALQAVNEQYGKYLPNMEKEGINADNIAKAYDQITDALIRQAVVKGIQKEIEELVTKTATAIIKLEKAEEQKRIATEKANTATKQEIPAMDAAAKKMQQYQGTIKDGSLAQIDQRKEVTKSIGSINNYETAIASLTTKLKAQLAPLLKLTTNFEDLDISLKLPKKVKIDKEFRPDVIVKIPISPEFIFDDKTFKFVALGGDIKTFKEQIEDNINKEIEKLVVSPHFNFSPKVVANRENLKNMEIASKQLTDTFNQTLSSGFASAFESVGEGIGNLLSGDGFGDGLTKAIGGLLINLGKALIQFGVIKKFVDNLLANPFFKSGAAVIGVGIAAIAIGTALKNLKSGSGGRAAGGGVQRGQSVWVGENGKELFTPNTGGRITSNNALAAGATGSGGIMVNVQGRFVQRGQDLLAVITLANQSRNRLQ